MPLVTGSQKRCRRAATVPCLQKAFREQVPYVIDLPSGGSGLWQMLKMAATWRNQPPTSNPLKGEENPICGGPIAGNHAYRITILARALAASSSRFFGGCVVSSESISSRAHAAIELTARSKTASLRFDGLVVPLS